MGALAYPDIFRIRPRSSNPSMSGILISVMIMSKRYFFRAERASPPLCASVTPMPIAFIISLSTSRLISLSSISKSSLPAQIAEKSSMPSSLGKGFESHKPKAILKLKAEPFPGADSRFKVSLPPLKSSIIILQIERPSPVPP